MNHQQAGASVASSRRAVVALAAIAGLLGAAGAARADWLVTREQGRVETRGAWEIKGRMVVFTLPNGTLSSLRLEEVDLPASERATAAAKARPPAPAPAEPKKPVLVLTDADVPRVTRPPAAAAAQPDEGGGVNPSLEVVSWTELTDPRRPGVHLAGTLRNNGTDVATGLTVTVRLLGPDGELLAEGPALLAPTSLAAGRSTNFRADFPEVASYTSVAFEAASKLAGRTSPTPVPPEGGAGES
jgi:hypothetical protein